MWSMNYQLLLAAISREFGLIASLSQNAGPVHGLDEGEAIIHHKMSSIVVLDHASNI